jgi:hypothetical protein
MLKFKFWKKGDDDDDNPASHRSEETPLLSSEVQDSEGDTNAGKVIIHCVRHAQVSHKTLE